MKRKKKKKSSGKQTPAAPEYSVDEIISQFWDEYEETDFDLDGEDSDTEADGELPAVAEPALNENSVTEEESVTDDLLQWLEDAKSWSAPAEQEKGVSAEAAAEDVESAEDTSWSIHDILDEYRENELVEEIVTEEDRTGTDENIPAERPSPGETVSAKAEEESSAVWESFPETSLVSGIADIAEAVPREPKEEEPEEIEDLNFDLPYSIRDIMQEFWTSGETAEDASAAPEEPSAREETDWHKVEIGPESAPEEVLPEPEAKDEKLDFSWGALLWGKDEEAEPEAVTEEIPSSEETVAEEEDGGEPAAPAADSEEETSEPVPSASPDADSGDAVGKRPKRKVVEEFPDTPKPSDEPFVDTLDYAALFKMFAEEPAAPQEEPLEPEEEAERPDGKTDAEEFEDWLASSGMSPEEVLAAIEAPPSADDRKQPAAPEEKAPLLAEQSDEMDFRDILREFMMGDRHPIYGDVPGIGRQPGDTALEEAQESADSEDDAREEAATPRPRREYKVEEDFPLDLDEFMHDSRADRTPAADAKPASESADHDAGSLTGGMPAGYTGDAEDPSAEEVPEESTFRSRLRDILAGRRILPERKPDGKKARNEPKAYVGYEDYLPDEAAAKAEAGTAAEEQPDRTGGAHAAPDGGDLPDGIGGAAAASASEALAGDSLSDDDLLDYEADFPTFGQWILNELMNLWIRINGVGDRQSVATMEDEREDPGPEVNVASASRYYGSQVTMLRMRFQLGLALLAVLAYITLGFPVSGMLKTAKVASAVCLGLQLTILLLCLDVVTNALMNLMRGRFGADALALLACIVSSFDALVVAVGGFGTPHIPLCLFSSLAMIGLLFSSLLSARALRKSTRVPAIGKRAYCVTAEEGVRGGKDITLLKSIRPVSGFVRRAEEAPPDETLFNRFAFPALLAVLVLSLLTGLVKHSMRDFLYILSAMLSCTVPVTALAAFALPFFVGSQRIFSSGAAVAGWSGIHDIGCSRNLIVTDRDLFPEETISIETVRVFADESAERVIAYAGTMIAASGSGLGPCFSELMERNGCRMRQVEDFKWLAGGGLQGLIEGHVVLCGSSDLMQLMNVKIPYRLVDRTTVLLSIDGVLYGIFKIVYTGQPEIRSALQELIASNRHPIFAIRDFNITPDMLHEVFDVATDGYDFPPYGDRFRISEAQPSETSKVSAVVCREGLGPLTHLADTGRSMYVAVRLNLLITVLTAILGTLLVFFRLIGPGLLNAWLPFVLMIVDMILVTMITVFMRF